MRIQTIRLTGRTVTENFNAVLVGLRLSQEKLQRTLPLFTITNGEVAITVDPQKPDDEKMALFLWYQFGKFSRQACELTPDKRVAMYRYFTDGVVYDARHHFCTRWQALRLLELPGSKVTFKSQPTVVVN